MVSNNLIFYRRLNNLTQQQVADYLGLCRTTYTKYETGDSEPSFSILRKLVELYNIDFNNIFCQNK
ncbi:MAG: helix-turn-helix transcriptional regulator [Ruminococcus sp.]